MEKDNTFWDYKIDKKKFLPSDLVPTFLAQNVKNIWKDFSEYFVVLSDSTISDLILSLIQMERRKT